MPSKLRQAFGQLEISKQDQDYLLPAVLGFMLQGRQTVDVPNRPGFVYARIRSNLNEVVQVFNDKVSPVYNLPVLLIRDPNSPTRYKVEGRDVGRYQNWGTSSAFLPKHGGQHSFNPGAGIGGDPVWIYTQQFIPWSVIPSGTYGANNVFINGHPTYQNGTWAFWGNTGTASLSSYVPTGAYARMVLVGLDSYGNPNLIAGSTFDVIITGSASILDYIPSPTGTFIPLAGIYLPSGTAVVGWENIYDVRSYFASLGGDTGTPATSVSSGTYDDLIRLWDISLSEWKLYPATDGGLDAAMTALAADDVLWLPVKQFTGNYTLPNYVTIIGVTPWGEGTGVERGNCEISTRVTGTAVFSGGNEVTLQNLSIYAYSDNYSLDAIGVNFTSGYGALVDVKIYARHSIPSGTSYAIKNATAASLYGGHYRARRENAYYFPFDALPEGYYAGKDELSSNDSLIAKRFRAGGVNDYVSISQLGTMQFYGDANLLAPFYEGLTSDPPSASEITSILGSPSSAGDTAIINVTGTNQYLVVADGTNWWYLSMTKAV